MKKSIRINRIQSFLTSGRAVQAGWLLFTLIAFSLAAPGFSTYQAALETPCSGTTCLTGQLLPDELQTVTNVGDTLKEYASIVWIIILFTNALLLLSAAVLVWRKPGNPAVACLGLLLTAAAMGPAANAAVSFDARSGAALIDFVRLALVLPAFALLPDGRFRPGWLRWAALAAIPASAWIAFGPGEGQGTSYFSVAFSLGVAATITLSFLYRWFIDRQRGDPLNWTITAVLLLACAQGLGRPLLLLPLPYASIGILAGVAFTPYPILGMLLVVGGVTCLAIALLGDELFRVDLALNRAIVYSLLTLFVVGGYVLVVGYLSLVFQSSGSLWLSLIATGVIAALFHPIRVWLQRFVNRIVYGERDNPYSVISQLGDRLETVMALDQVIPTILHTVRESLKIPYAAIRLKQAEDSSPGMMVEDGSPGPVALSLPMTYQNEIIGELLLSLRTGEDHFSPADQQLLNGLARQAGAAIHAVRLTTDLQYARERLVLAQEEERRRIRRDLHDGLGATLAGLSLQAGEAQRLMVSDPEAAGRSLTDLRAGLRAAIGDTRRLVYGLRPPALDELGLLDALRNRVAQHRTGEPFPSDGLGESQIPNLQIRFDAPDHLPSVPAAVEVAIYRIVEEGLANIIHHSHAANGLVKLSLEENGICIEMLDDGVGLAEEFIHGIGLNSMRERATELGGRWSIQSDPGMGTQVSAWLPLFSPKREE